MDDKNKDVVNLNLEKRIYIRKTSQPLLSRASTSTECGPSMVKRPVYASPLARLDPPLGSTC